MLWERELAAREKKKHEAYAKNERAANLARKSSKKAGKANPFSKPSSSPAKRNFKSPAQIDSQPMLASRSIPALGEPTKPVPAPMPKVSRSQLHHRTILGPVEEDASKGARIGGKRCLHKDEPDRPGTFKIFKKNPSSGSFFTANRPLPYVKVERGPPSRAERTRSVFREVIRRSRPDRVSTSFSDSSDSPSS